MRSKLNNNTAVSPLPLKRLISRAYQFQTPKQWSGLLLLFFLFTSFKLLLIDSCFIGLHSLEKVLLCIQKPILYISNFRGYNSFEVILCCGKHKWHVKIHLLSVRVNYSSPKDFYVKEIILKWGLISPKYLNISIRQTIK